MLDKTRKPLFPQLEKFFSFGKYLIVLFSLSILAKGFVPSKNRGASIKKNSSETTTVLKTKFVLVHRENQIVKRKIIILENLAMPKNVKGGTGDPLGFLKIQFVAKC